MNRATSQSQKSLHAAARAFLLLSLLALFACLLWPGQAKAVDHPFGHCAGARTGSCTLTVAANQTIFIKESFGGSPVLPGDTLPPDVHTSSLRY